MAQKITVKQAYKTMLTDYPDVLDLKNICEILNINRKTAYKALNSGQIPCVRISGRYKVAKLDLLNYLIKSG